MEDKGLFCRKHNWKICLAGFFSDFIGCIFLFICIYFIQDLVITNGLNMNPFRNIWSLLLVLVSIVISGLCIYILDYKILKKTDLDISRVKRSALMLAILTAPYLYLIPSCIFYQ